MSRNKPECLKGFVRFGPEAEEDMDTKSLCFIVASTQVKRKWTEI